MSTDRYNDIINLPHHVSAKHPQMSMHDRAAQFAPFAALTGYGEAIDETGRTTDEATELSESERTELDCKFQSIQAYLNAGLTPRIIVTRFIPDARKDGGTYQTLTASVKRIDFSKHLMILTDGTAIPIPSIISLK